MKRIVNYINYYIYLIYFKKCILQLALLLYFNFQENIMHQFKENNFLILKIKNKFIIKSIKQLLTINLIFNKLL